MQQIEINEILAMIPHRYPFLLVDKVLKFTPMESIVGIKMLLLMSHNLLAIFLVIL